MKSNENYKLLRAFYISWAMQVFCLDQYELLYDKLYVQDTYMQTLDKYL